MGNARNRNKGKDWSPADVEVQLPSGELIGFESIDYGSEVDTAVVNTFQGKPMAYRDGDYKGTFSCELHKDEYLKLKAAAKAKNKGIYQFVFPVTINMSNEDMGSTTDVLPAVKITKKGNSLKRGSGGFNIKLDGVLLAIIEEDGDPDYV